MAEYKPQMGLLIDVQNPKDYQLNHHPDSINIHADHLLVYYKKYLEKGKKYYITCHKGFLSRKVVAMLEFLGYDVTQVLP
ncbi:MAG: rhodanese-like domain-containing protein [Firmicutes bacterium]|nr:rhodanese-like domain-containing protein [Bacillota bacterium]